MNKKNENKLKKLSAEDREKYLVFSKMGKLKITAIVLCILSVCLFTAGLVIKSVLLMLAGAVLLTVFAVIIFMYSNAKAKWEKLMKDSRKKQKNK